MDHADDCLVHLQQQLLQDRSITTSDDRNGNSRNSTGFSATNSNNCGDTHQTDFAARFSDFASSTRRIASSDHPVIETFIDNDDYQSLMASVSSLRMSHSQHCGDLTLPSGASEDLPHGNSAHPVQELDHATCEAPNSPADAYNSPPMSYIENIYDMRHIMVHNQRELEGQLHQHETSNHESQQSLPLCYRLHLLADHRGCSHTALAIAGTGMRKVQDITPPTEAPYYNLTMGYTDHLLQEEISRCSASTALLSLQLVIETKLKTMQADPREHIPGLNVEPDFRNLHTLLSATYLTGGVRIPSQPPTHPQHTSSAEGVASEIYHHNGTTGYNDRSELRLSGVDHSELTHPYSETVERAEAGGWITPPFSSTAQISNSSLSVSGTPYQSRPRGTVDRKEVVRMACNFCKTIICERGMRAQLLADQSVALLSTDDDPQSGNTIGYHITQPCEKCLSADNNGHLWLFHPEFVLSAPRWNFKLDRAVQWGELPEPGQDLDALSLQKVYQCTSDGKLVLGGMVHRDYDDICR
ncbi:Protein fam72a [Mortierella sp. GBA43]|nr:Protein fam72a [Mortierella sp. GBA43]